MMLIFPLLRPSLAGVLEAVRTGAEDSAECSIDIPSTFERADEIAASRSQTQEVRGQDEGGMVSGNEVNADHIVDFDAVGSSSSPKIMVAQKPWANRRGFNLSMDSLQLNLGNHRHDVNIRDHLNHLTSWLMAMYCGSLIYLALDRFDGLISDHARQMMKAAIVLTIVPTFIIPFQIIRRILSRVHEGDRSLKSDV